jgi:hypothetical protein
LKILVQNPAQQPATRHLQIDPENPIATAFPEKRCWKFFNEWAEVGNFY